MVGFIVGLMAGFIVGSIASFIDILVPFPFIMDFMGFFLSSRELAPSTFWKCVDTPVCSAEAPERSQTVPTVKASLTLEKNITVTAGEAGGDQQYEFMAEREGHGLRDPLCACDTSRILRSGATKTKTAFIHERPTRTSDHGRFEKYLMFKHFIFFIINGRISHLLEVIPTDTYCVGLINKFQLHDYGT
jgi:hypothetical protein